LIKTDFSGTTKAVRNGGATDSVSKAIGVNIRTVFRWLADFSMGGQIALLAKPIRTPD
jgi:hypothetical protein